MKGTDCEGADKKAAQESTRRFRERCVLFYMPKFKFILSQTFLDRNSQELANRQCVRRAHTFIDKYGWDTWTDQHTRRMQQAEQLAAAAQKEMREAQGLAEEEDEWADRG
jgi:N-methylhydantoinase B/oxoprolinase/acetone carboxylase alpha subunit